MSKKILFLETPGRKDYFFAKAMKHPLLGPLYLATKLKQLGYDAKVIKDNLVDDETLQKALEDADILFMSVLTMSIKRNIEVAQQYKKIHPDRKVIAGGIHVSLNPNECLQYFDQIVVGEGLSVIQDLVEGKFSDRIVHASPVDSLEEHPIVDFSLLTNSHKLKMIPIMTSLGCPFDCTFCCVTKMYGRKYRTQGTQKTICELKSYFTQLGKQKKVFFFDDNFCANKSRSLELFNAIKEEQMKFLWICQVRADLAKDPDFVQKMAEAGCRRVFIGFESINDSTLKALHKNETREMIEKAIEVFHRYGIAIHGMFVFGTDQEDNTVFDQTVDFCVKNHIESAQFFCITPFPGTEFENGLEKERFLTRNYDEYDGFHVIFQPKGMTSYELMKGVLYAHEKMYSWMNCFRQIGFDMKNIVLNRNRTISYQILKLGNNFKRYFEFRYLTRVWKKHFRNYLEDLKKIPLYDSISNQNNVPLVNNHAVRDAESIGSHSNLN